MIAGLEPCSFIDFPGRLSAVVFTQGCNLRCRYCHNPRLCSPSDGPGQHLGELEWFLAHRVGRLEGVVVTGGEPTLHQGLPALLRAARSLGFATKLDTNGTRPGAVLRLLQEGLVDFVAIDLKIAPGTSSLRLCGVERQAEQALETLGHVLSAGVPNEVRTTVVRGFHDRGQLQGIAEALASAEARTWRLQPVRPGRVLDPSVVPEPPAASLLTQAVATAEALGLDAAVRSSSQLARDPAASRPQTGRQVRGQMAPSTAMGPWPATARPQGPSRPAP
jgi:pyruvate formate lyase activating enzyme